MIFPVSELPSVAPPTCSFSGRIPTETGPVWPSSTRGDTRSTLAVDEPDRIWAFDGAGEQVRHAEEVRHERRGRAFVEIRRAAELLDVPTVHDDDEVGHRHRFFLVVRDVDEGDPDVALDVLELELHLLAELQVECAERLVEQQHARDVDERAGECDALLLATRQLLRLAAAVAGEPDDPQHLVDLPLQLGAALALAAQAERDVLEDRQVREERVALEDGVHVTLVRRQAGDRAVAEVDRPRARLLEAADHPQRGRLAAAGRSEQRVELAALDLERQVVDGDDLVELLRHVLEANVGAHAVAVTISSSRCRPQPYTCLASCR